MNELKKWQKGLEAIAWYILAATLVIAIFAWSQDNSASALTEPHKLLYVRGNTSGEMLTVYVESGGLLAIQVDSDAGMRSSYHALMSGDRTSMMLDVCGGYLYLASVTNGIAESYSFELPGDAHFRCGKRPFVVYFPIVGGE